MDLQIWYHKSKEFSKFTGNYYIMIQILYYGSDEFIDFELYKYLKAFDIELQNRQKHFRRCFDAGAYRLRNYWTLAV